MEKCPICLIESEINRVESKTICDVYCNKCGNFTTSVQRFEILKSRLGNEDDSSRVKLSNAINKHLKDNNIPTVYIDDILANLCIKESIDLD